MSKGFLKKYLNDEQLRGIASKISEQERLTDGEIHVCIRHRRHWNERRLTLHEIALKEFFKLGMDKTRNRTGILIMLLFNERKFQIIADEGIHSKVPDGTWDNVASAISVHFANERFFDGICAAVEAVGSELQKFFPRRDDDTNEISDEVDVR
jgi:uncharacterized membrane protein